MEVPPHEWICASGHVLCHDSGSYTDRFQQEHAAYTVMGSHSCVGADIGWGCAEDQEAEARIFVNTCAYGEGHAIFSIFASFRFDAIRSTYFISAEYRTYISWRYAIRHDEQSRQDFKVGGS